MFQVTDHESHTNESKSIKDDFSKTIISVVSLLSAAPETWLGWNYFQGFLSLPYTISDPAGMEGLKAENSTRSISAHRRLPLKTIYFFDPYRSPIFEFIYFQQCVSIVAGATSNFSIDSFLALLGLHFCGQFEILGINIEHYSGIVKHDQSNQIYSGSCTCISCIIEKHLRIMR